jgi:predicted transcriptional regulator/GNAT superfamily N-acetyltransferase
LDIIYAYSFPAYLNRQEGLLVKIGRTTGEQPERAASERVRSQVGTSNPEQPVLLSAVTVPDRGIEMLIHSHLKQCGQWIDNAPGREWFKFDNRALLDTFLKQLQRCSLIRDFQDFGRVDTVLESGTREEVFHRLERAYGIRTILGGAARNQIPDSFIKELESALSPQYPDFASWLNRTLADEKTTINLAVEGEDWMGLAIWKQKSDYRAKLSTLFVLPQFRGEQVGERLMLRCLEQWRIRRFASVVVSTAKRDLLDFFNRFGFLLEGVGRQCYGRDREDELFLTKIMVTQAQEIPAQVEAVARSLLPLPNGLENIFALPIALSSGSWHCTATSGGITLEAEGIRKQFSRSQWGSLVFPAICGIENEFYMLPVQPSFLIRRVGRSWTYFGTPRFADADLNDSTVFIYASAPVTAIVGEAVIASREIGSAKELFSRLGKSGVLSETEFFDMYPPTKEIQSLSLKRFMLYQQSITLEEAREQQILNGPPQSFQRVPYEAVKKIRGVE